MIRSPITEQELADRRKGRIYRNSIWTAAYRARRRHQAVWMAVFLLLFALLALLPFLPLLYARFGK